MRGFWWWQRDAEILEQVRMYREERRRQNQERREDRREKRDYVAIGIALFAAAFTCWQAWEAHQTRIDTQVQFEQAQKRADKAAAQARDDAREAVDAQTKLADRSTHQAKESADAAKDAGQSAKRQVISFENSQRGQLAIENFSYVSDDSHVHYELWNHGNSIIRDIGERGPTGIGFEWVTFGEIGMANLIKKWRPMVTSDWRGYSIPAGQHRDYDVPAPTTSERRTHISSGPSQDMLFFGRIYTGIDIFGDEQSAVICVQSFKGGFTRCRLNPEQ
jgi:hypothetical protein